MLNRNSKEYQDQKAAFEIVESPAWKEFLKPYLEGKIKEDKRDKPLTSVDEALIFNYELGKKDQARLILSHLEAKAKQFRSTP